MLESTNTHGIIPSTAHIKLRGIPAQSMNLKAQPGETTNIYTQRQGNLWIGKALVQHKVPLELSAPAEGGIGRQG